MTALKWKGFCVKVYFLLVRNKCKITDTVYPLDVRDLPLCHPLWTRQQDWVYCTRFKLEVRHCIVYLPDLKEPITFLESISLTGQWAETHLDPQWTSCSLFITTPLLLIEIVVTVAGRAFGTRAFSWGRSGLSLPLNATTITRDILRIEVEYHYYFTKATNPVNPLFLNTS